VKEPALRFKLLSEFVNFYKNKMMLSNTADETDKRGVSVDNLPISE
jgi:hypothetical protein